VTSPLLARTGAVEGAGPDAGVALHYGNPAREQRDLERGRAVVDLSQLGVVTIGGVDRKSWLHTLSTQHTDAIADGESTEMLLLDAQGRIQHAAGVVEFDDELWLLTEGAKAADLAAFLESMKFMLRVEVTDRSEEYAVLGTIGEGSAALAAGPHHVLTWRDPWPRTAAGGTRYAIADEDHPGYGVERCLSLVRREDLAAAVDASGLTLAGTWAWEAARVAAWRPRLGREVDERAIPHELDWLRTAVHLNKGCYRGQETVAKIVNLGRPPRRLVMLHLDGSEHFVPEPGAAVMNGERAVGHVTSVVRHEQDGPLALALVRRNTPPDAVLRVDDIPAAQEIIVSVEGASEARPAQRPGAELRGRRRP